MMENDLELAVLAGGDHAVICHIILNGIIRNVQESIEELPHFNLDEMDDT